MRTLIATLTILIASTALARSPEQQALYDAYKQRRADRRAYALVTRREMNAGKVHVYRTAVSVRVNVAPRSAIEQGMVYQPPIIRRRRVLSIDSMMSSAILQAEAFMRSY